MKIKYLGTAAAEGVPAIFCTCETCKRARELGGKNIRTRSQAMIDDSLLIDWPADSYYHMLKNGLDFTYVSTLLITHIHEDHFYSKDMSNRRCGFGHLDENCPQLNIYSSSDLFDQFMLDIEKYQRISSKTRPNTVNLKIVPPYETFNADGYDITPLRAYHGTVNPYVYIVEKDGKALLYAHDTDVLFDDAFDFIAKRGFKLSLVSLDCTMGNADMSYHGHMGLVRNAEVRKRLTDIGAADKDTIFVVNHFSHNGKNVLYDEMKDIAAEQGFVASYDGMEIEF